MSISKGKKLGDTYKQSMSFWKAKAWEAKTSAMNAMNSKQKGVKWSPKEEHIDGRRRSRTKYDIRTTFKKRKSKRHSISSKRDDLMRSRSLPRLHDGATGRKSSKKVALGNLKNETEWVRSTRSSRSSSLSGRKITTTPRNERMKLFNSLSQKFTEEELFQGDEKVLKELETTYKETLMDPRVFVDSKEMTTIKFHFTGVPAIRNLLGEARVFKIKPTSTVGQVIGNICRKCKLRPPFGYSLETLRHYRLKPSSDFRKYGFGSILPHWDLNFVKQTESEMAKKKGESYLVTFVLPPVPAFDGLAQKLQKVNPALSVEKVVALLRKKYGITDESRFKLGSTNGFLLDDKKTLGYYGLGKKFKSVTLFVIDIKRLSMGSATNTFYNEEFVWSLVDSNFNLGAARGVITAMDEKLNTATKERTEFMEELTKYKEQTSKLQSLNKRMKDRDTEMTHEFKELCDLFEGLAKAKEQIEEEFESANTQYRQKETEMNHTISEQVNRIIELENEKLYLEMARSKSNGEIQGLQRALKQQERAQNLLKEEISNMQEENTSLEYNISNYENRIKKLESKLRKESNMNKELMRHVQTQQNTIEENEQSLVDMQESAEQYIESLQDELEKRKSKYSNLQKQLSLAENQNEVLKQTNKDLVEEHSVEVSALRDENSNLHKQMKIQNDNARDDRSKLQAEMEAQFRQLSQGKEAFKTEMTSKLNRLLQEKSSTQHEMEELKSKAEETRASLQSGLNAAQDKVKSQAAALKSKDDALDSLKSEKETLQNEIEELNAKRNQLSRDHKAAVEKNKQVSTMLKKAKDETASKDKKLSELESEITNQKEKLEKRKQAQTQIQAKNKSLATENESMKSKLKEATDQQEFFENEMDILRSENERLKSKVDSSTRQLKTYRNSTITTTPLVLSQEITTQAPNPPKPKANGNTTNGITNKPQNSNRPSAAALMNGVKSLSKHTPDEAKKAEKDFRRSTFVLRAELFKKKRQLSSVDMTKPDPRQTAKKNSSDDLGHILLSSLNKRFMSVRNAEEIDDLDDFDSDSEDDVWD